MTHAVWAVKIVPAAEADLEDIGRWTEGQFGAAQADVYAQILADALATLIAGPAASGIRQRPEIGARLYSLHAGRHFIVFRASGKEERSIVVLRVLHDTMDLVRHIHKD